MLFDDISSVAANVCHQRVEIVAREVFGEAALLANEQVLVSFGGGNEGVTSTRLVHTLNEAEFFQFLQCAIHRHQPYGRVAFARQSVHFCRAEHALTLRHNVDNDSAWCGQPIAIGVQLREPIVGA